MSVSKYIEEFNASIEKAIQRNIEKAEANPYPSDEIKQLREQDPESALAQMFDEEGQVISPIGNRQLLNIAIDQDPDLYKKLRAGHRANQSLKRNEELETLDAEEYFNNLYYQFVSGIGNANSLGGSIDPEDILNPDNLEDFEEVASIGLDLDMSYVSDETIQAALLEKYSSPTEEEEEETEEQTETSPINTEDIIEEEEESFELAETSQTESEIVDINVEPSESLEIPEETATASPINEDTDEKIEDTEPTSILETMQEMGSDLVNEQENEDSQEVISTAEPLQDEVMPESLSTINQFENFEEANTSNITNETINNSFLEDGDIISMIENNVSNLENISSIESIPDSINLNDNITESTPINALSNTSNALSESIENISNISNLSQINDSSSDIFSSLNKDISNSIKEDITNVENNMNDFSTKLDTSSSFSSFDNSSIIKPEPITKEDITTVSKDISSGIASSMSIASESEDSVQQEEPSKREIRKEERQERRENRQAEKNESNNINNINDYSSLEKRLKNIEILLSGPLEVKIKN